VIQDAGRSGEEAYRGRRVPPEQAALSAAQLAAVDEAFGAAGPDTPRRRAVVGLMRYAGLTGAEVAALTIAEVILVGDARIEVGGGRARTVPVHPDLAPMLRAWYQLRDIRGAMPGDPLFPNRTGGHLNARSITGLVKKVGEQAGLALSPAALHALFLAEQRNTDGDAAPHTAPARQAAGERTVPGETVPPGQRDGDRVQDSLETIILPGVVDPAEQQLVQPKPMFSGDPVLHGEVVPPTPTGHYTPPQGVLDLIFRMWLTLNFRRAAQVLMLAIAGLLLFLGLGYLAHVVLGTPAVWSALGGGAAGLGAGAGAYRYVKRKSGREDQGTRGHSQGRQRVRGRGQRGRGQNRRRDQAGG
jgi:hypothetical protein